MSIKFTISCLFVLSCLVSRSQEIQVKDIIETFYGTYDVTAFQAPTVEFEKKKSDWYYKTFIIKDGLPVLSNPVLFYSGQQKKYLDQDLIKRDSFIAIDYLEFINENEVYSYDLQPFYGYAGWYDDVIAEFRKQARLSDRNLYALGRAYSAKAMDPVLNQWGEQGSSPAYKMPFSLNAFTPEQKKRFLLAEDSALSKFRQLAARNPYFKTRVGDIRDKYANEVMVRFHTLLTFSTAAVKDIKLPGDLYRDSLLNITKDVLTKIPEGSILLSFGDNDFYPVLYMQHAKGLRKDVHLINYNLLFVDKYIYRATQPQFDARGIKMTADTLMYKSDRNQVVYIRDSARTALLPDFMRFLRTTTAEVEPHPHYSARALRIRLHWGDGEKQTADIPLNGKGYLLRNEWIILDILNNLEGRKFCLPQPFYDDLSSLNPFFIEADGFWQYDN